MNEVAPEELAAVILRQLNERTKRERPKFNLTSYCTEQSALYAQNNMPACELAISTALSYLVVVGMLAPSPEDHQFGWLTLTARGRNVRTEADYKHFKKLSLYPKGHIHPVIERETYAEFLRGDYETAVFKAFKAIEIAIRPHTGAPGNVVGRDLMVKAFQPDSGTLRDPGEITAERESPMELYRGAIGRFKNPTSHREVDFEDPSEVIEILQLASLLMRIAERKIASALNQPEP